MKIFGIVRAVRKNEATGFVEAQVEVDLNKLDWFELSTCKGIQWKPKEGDKVQVLMDDRGEGVVVGGYVTELLDDDTQMQVQNIEDKDYIVKYKDDANSTKAQITNGGEGWFSQVDIQDGFTGSFTIGDNTVVTTKKIKWQGTEFEVLVRP